MIDQKHLYRKRGGRHYFSVRPGITGTWQVYGRGKTSFISRVAYDRLYVSKRSPVLDLQIIFKTFKILTKRSGH